MEEAPLIIQSILYLVLGWVIFVPFILYRNVWVRNKRGYVLWKRHPYEYDKLPEYNTMLWKFWIWDVEKFKENK